MYIRIKKEQYSSAEKVYLLIWTFYSVSYFFLSASELPYDYAMGGLFRYATYATIMCQLLLLVFLQRYSLKKMVTYLLFLLLALLVEIAISDRSFIVYMLFIILARNISFDKLVRYDIKLKLAILVSILFMCAVGIIENYSNVMNGNYKQALGFSHPNIFTCYVFTILIEWLCIRYKKMKWYEWLCIIAVAVFTAEIGGGRSSTYTFVIIFALYIIAAKMPKAFYTKISKTAFSIVTPLMAILSFWAVQLYNQGNATAIALNSILTNRISGAAYFARTYEYKLFGQEIEFISTRNAQLQHTSSLILDNAYVRCALYWGIILFAVLMVAYCFLFVKLLNDQRVDLALFCLFFVILGIGESNMLNVLYNLPFLCILGYREMSYGKVGSSVRSDKKYLIGRRG